MSRHDGRRHFLSSSSCSACNEHGQATGRPQKQSALAKAQHKATSRRQVGRGLRACRKRGRGARGMNILMRAGSSRRPGEAGKSAIEVRAGTKRRGGVAARSLPSKVRDRLQTTPGRAAREQRTCLGVAVGQAGKKVWARRERGSCRVGGVARG